MWSGQMLIVSGKKEEPEKLLPLVAFRSKTLKDGEGGQTATFIPPGKGSMCKEHSP